MSKRLTGVNTAESASTLPIGCLKNRHHLSPNLAFGCSLHADELANRSLVPGSKPAGIMSELQTGTHGTEQVVLRASHIFP